MVIGDFYTQVIAVAIAGLTIIGLLWKHYADKIDKLDESTSQDEYLISAYLWSSSIKNSVKDFVNLIQQNLANSDPRNEDPYEEIFYDENRDSTIKERLDSLHKSYSSYVTFNQLLPRLVSEMEIIKNWLGRLGVFCFGFFLWGLAYFFLEANSLAIYPYLEILWAFFITLLGATIFCLNRFTVHNKKYSIIKNTLRTEKAKYGPIIRKTKSGK